MSTFRLTAKSFLLTFPQCSATKEELLANLQSLGISGAVVCKESHADGSPHLHAFCCFSRKKDIRNARYFDFNNFHGRYESARDCLAAIAYVKKDGDFIEWGDIPKQKRKWSEVHTARTKEEAMQIALEVSPRDYALCYDRLDSFLSKKFKPVQPEYSSPFEVSLPHAVQMWVDQMDQVRPKSLILWGPSRTGKTILARSIGKHMYFNGMFNLDQLDSDAKYAIFDDWDDWGKFFQYKQWLGSQSEFVVTDKYRTKRRFLWGKPSIVLSNSKPTFPDMEWIAVNCIVVHVQNKLF